MPLLDAVVNSCRIRLRPILMTSLATIFGLMPMALKLGTGSEAYAPLARAIIGGLIVSVALTVFIVPAAYLLVYRPAGRRGRGESVVMRRIARHRLCLRRCWPSLASPRRSAQPLSLQEAEARALREPPAGSRRPGRRAGRAARSSREARVGVLPDGRTAA